MLVRARHARLRWKRARPAVIATAAARDTADQAKSPLSARRSPIPDAAHVIQATIITGTPGGVRLRLKSTSLVIAYL